MDSRAPEGPHPNGKVERSFRIDDEEFYRLLAGEVIDDAELFKSKLQDWEHFYISRSARRSGGLIPLRAAKATH